ncbi:hypothetical protein TL16_g12415 [Triparma laevis f. inornata]|uniref:Uncharacterized protein n=1 Tax=Triparma laevis f. inornata TaxID=1714386 RepID=A0A9W7BLM3_9STRA|nr:hypothetical protein TL16_g12415 [Triparma laevis f. inornata]
MCRASWTFLSKMPSSGCPLFRPAPFTAFSKYIDAKPDSVTSSATAKMPMNFDPPAPLPSFVVSSELDMLGVVTRMAPHTKLNNATTLTLLNCLFKIRYEKSPVDSTFSCATIVNVLASIRANETKDRTFIKA